MKEKSEKKKISRQPIIVIMGHIDHGKSTLLDYIRQSNIVASEAGGITQHVGAYEASYKDKNGKEHRLTFLDTPGHEAFFGIRKRGAKVADIAILVISAEEGVKPQTLEALKCLRDSETPFVVVLNKIDRPGVDIERIKQNLAENEIYVEGYGGSIPWVAISALTGQGVPELLELIGLMAEMEELTGDASLPASGTIVESSVDSKKGVVSTLLVRNGTLKLGDFVVSNESFCPIRSIEDFSGHQVKEIGLSRPARIIGWNCLPPAGAEFVSVKNKKQAEKMTSEFIEKFSKTRVLRTEISDEKTVVIPLLLKADTAGSLEATIHELKKVNVEGIKLVTIGAGVGTISEKDVKVASAATNPYILGFNVKIDNQAKSSAERLGVKILTFGIIYKLTDWLKEEVELKRPRLEVEDSIGRVKVLKLFSAEKERFVIGGRVELGSVKNGSFFKILRRDTEIGRGKVRSLQQLKSKVDEVKKDTEFGALVESKIEPAPGDKLELFVTSFK